MEQQDDNRAGRYGLTGRRRPRQDVLEIGGRKLRPSTLMMGYGYDPALSEGALKPPIFLTSTFTFEPAQEGKDFFDVTSEWGPAAGDITHASSARP